MKCDANFRFDKTSKRIFASTKLTKAQSHEYKKLMIQAQLCAVEADRTRQKQKVDLND